MSDIFIGKSGEILLKGKWVDVKPGIKRKGYKRFDPRKGKMPVAANVGEAKKVFDKDKKAQFVMLADKSSKISGPTDPAHRKLHAGMGKDKGATSKLLPRGAEKLYIGKKK